MRLSRKAVTATATRPGTNVIIREGVLEGVRATVLGVDDDFLLLSIQLLEEPVVAVFHADCVSLEHPFVGGGPWLEH